MRPLLLVISLTLISCSNVNRHKSNYEKDSYEHTEDYETWEEPAYSIHKNGHILEYNKKGELIGGGTFVEITEDDLK